MPEAARVLAESTDHRYLTNGSDDTTAVASIRTMGSGTLVDFEGLYTADAVNREAITEHRTPAARDRPPCTPPPAGCAPPSAT